MRRGRHSASAVHVGAGAGAPARTPAAGHSAHRARPSTGQRSGRAGKSGARRGLRASKSAPGLRGTGSFRPGQEPTASRRVRPQGAGFRPGLVAVPTARTSAAKRVLAGRPALQTRQWVSPHARSAVRPRPRDPTPGPGAYAAVDADGRIGSRSVSGRYRNPRQPVPSETTRRQSCRVFAPGQPVVSKFHDQVLPGPADYGPEIVARAPVRRRRGPVAAALAARDATTGATGGGEGSESGGGSGGGSAAGSGDGSGGGEAAVGRGSPSPQQVQADAQARAQAGQPSAHAASRGWAPLAAPRAPRSDPLAEYGGGGAAEQMAAWGASLRSRPKSANPALRRKSAAYLARVRSLVKVPEPLLGSRSGSRAGPGPGLAPGSRAGEGRPASTPPDRARAARDSAVTRRRRPKSAAPTRSRSRGRSGTSSRVRPGSSSGRRRPPSRASAVMEGPLAKTPKALPAFAGRSTAHETPGVGAYSPPPNVRGRVVRSFRDTCNDIRDDGTGFGRMKTSRSNALLGGQDATHTRYRPPTEESVGPGSYAVEMARPSHLARSKAVPMATAKRRRLPRRNSVTVIGPGPTDYNVGHDTAVPGKRRAASEAAVPFAVVTRKQRMRTYLPDAPVEPADADVETPGPGRYRCIGDVSGTGVKQAVVSSIANTPAFAFSTSYRAVSDPDPLMQPAGAGRL